MVETAKELARFVPPKLVVHHRAESSINEDQVRGVDPSCRAMTQVQTANNG